MWVKIQAVHY